MLIKQKVKILIATALMIGLPMVGGAAVLAATCGKDAQGNTLSTSVIDCSGVADKDTNGDGVIDDKDLENNGIWKLLLVAINILTAGVGIAALGGIVYGAILYTTAGGNAEQTKKALVFITNVIIGLVAFGAMFALLNFIIPGGLFTQ